MNKFSLSPSYYISKLRKGFLNDTIAINTIAVVVGTSLYGKCEMKG